MYKKMYNKCKECRDCNFCKNSKYSIYQEEIPSRNIIYSMEMDNDILIYKDNNKKIVGEYDHVQHIGYVGKKTYKRKIWWLRAVEKKIGI